MLKKKELYKFSEEKLYCFIHQINKKTMKIITVLFVSALVLFLQNSSASLDEGCKRLHAVNRNESYEFCVTSLQVDPDSRTANLSQLTLIASKLTKKNYTHTFGVIQQLLGNQSLSHSQREALGACNETYSSEIEHADIAIVDLETGDPEDAVGLLQAAARAPGNCESAFSDRHEASLIPGEDALASLISALARDLAVLLNYKG